MGAGAGLLLVLLVATALHWLASPGRARAHLRHPAMRHFYGAPPMALLTVGAGTLLVGRDVLGLPAALGRGRDAVDGRHPRRPRRRRCWCR